MNTAWKTRYEARDRTTEDQHRWLKQNYKKYGFKSAAALLEEIIKDYISNH